jgi:hypothetical protein
MLMSRSLGPSPAIRSPPSPCGEGEGIARDPFDLFAFLPGWPDVICAVVFIWSVWY